MLANGVLWRPASGAPGRVMMLLAFDLADAIRRRLSMFVLRAKVVGQDVRDRYVAAGPRGCRRRGCRTRRARGLRRAAGRQPSIKGDATALGAAGRPRSSWPARPPSAPIIHAALARHASTADAEMWRWFGIARRRADDHGRDVGPVRSAGCQLGRARRHQFPEGLLSGPGNRRAHAISRAAQGAAVRLPYRSGGHRAGGAAVFDGVRRRQPAAPSSTRRPIPPAAAARCWPSCSWRRSRRSRPPRCSRWPAAVRRSLPYAVPERAARRARRGCAKRPG